MFMRQIFIIGFLYFFSINAFTTETIILTGKVLDEQHHPIIDVFVDVNGQVTRTDSHGKYSLKLAFNESYLIKFSYSGYYSSIHTFSFHELRQQRGDVTDVFLVKKKENRVLLAFAGDVMMGRRFYQPYFGDPVLIHPKTRLKDSKSLVQHIKPYMILADYASVNLETQILTKKPAQSASKSVIFYSQPETLAALAWAGIDYVSLGNNHTYDYLQSGLKSTLQHLNQSPLAFSGAGINEQDALKAHQQTINNTDFAMLGFVGWHGSKKAKQTTDKHQGGAAWGSMENIVTSVSKQVQNNQTAIVQYHGSQEYSDNPTGITEARLKAAIDAGAGLAIAHHPHVAQGVELYKNQLIAYSLGNFIFDQNFTATQHSFILYVWLDEGQFHRAELIPIYVKGYKPTPSTGMHRYTVMKRLMILSAQRRTVITVSGGHGVITSQPKLSMLQDEKQQFQLNFAPNEMTTSLYHLPWYKTIKSVKLSAPDTRYRLGTNLINGSDFESFMLFDAPERTWFFNKNITTLNAYGANSQRSIKLSLQGKTIAPLGMQSFRRVFNVDNPVTIQAKFKTKSDIKVNFFWQGRKHGQGLFDAYQHGEKQLINSVKVGASVNWQTLEVDFNSPRIGYKSYRVFAEIQLLNTNEKSTVDIDDFALIEWQSAFSTDPEPEYYRLLTKQASYLGVNKNISTPVTVSLQ